MTATMETKRAVPPIQVKTLRKSFGKQKVLNGIDLQVAQGETLSVLGQSGTGKSVLLKIIIGLQQPDSGSIRIHGQEITGLSRKQLNEIRKSIGFLFQNSALYDSLTVEQNVGFPLERHSNMSDAERKKRVRELLATVGMEKDLDKLPGQISGGMQKRVGLARALALSPDILLFDEPTAGLDPITAVGNRRVDSEDAKRRKHDVDRRHARPAERADGLRSARADARWTDLDRGIVQGSASQQRRICRPIPEQGSLGGDLCRAHFDWACSSWQRL